MKKPVIPKSLREFCSDLKIKKAVVFNKNLFEIIKEGRTTYYFFPVIIAGKLKDLL